MPAEEKSAAPWLRRLKKYRPDWITLVLLGLIVYLWFRPPAWVTDLDTPVADARAVLLRGDTVELSQWRGKVVLVNFWATWCPYCRHEMPAMEEFYRDYRDKGFEILAVSTDEEEGTVREFLREEAYTFPVAMGNGELSHAFGSPSRLPTSFILDKQGHIRHKISGQVHYGRLEDLVEPLLKE
jgi:thiol-disulfide isomerase/thioredoxin